MIPIPVRSRILLGVLAIVLLGASGQVSSGDGAAPASIPGAKTCKQIDACRRAVAWQRHRYAKAEAALAWQKAQRVTDAKHATGYGVMHALRLASALYGVPLSQLVGVGTCESHLTPTSQNRSSTAAGLFQFLDSTWARAGVPGFSVYDPYANALAAARLVKADGGWHEWSCAFAA